MALALAILTLTGTGGPAGAPIGADKLYHAVAFAVLLLPTVLFNPERLRQAALLAMGYGVLIEIIQPLVGRSMEFADIVANGVGVGAALLLGRAVQSFLDQA